MTDVVVVGAGVIGLFCALRLAKAGARVTVLEAEPDDLSVYRPTASTAAAGMLAPFDAEGGVHECLALASFDLWRDGARGAAWADGVRFDGGVHIAERAEDAAAVQARMMQAGRDVSALSVAKVARITGLRSVSPHAVFTPVEGVADPIRVLSGLVMEARNLGVTLHFGADVRHVATHHATTHDDVTYEADCVVLAPGVWATDELAAAAPALRRLRPARGHLVAVRLARSLRPNVHVGGVYLAPRRDDVVLGSTLEFDRYDRAVDPMQTARLLAAAEAALPGQVKPAEAAWTGVRPMSPDGWPMIGHSGAVLIAAGHSRNGWLLAPITAEIISAYVFGGPIAPEWAALSPQRFEK